MKRENFFEGQQTEGNLEQLERRAHNLLNSWNHTAGVHSQKLYCTQCKMLELIAHSGHFRTDMFVFVFISDPFYSRSCTVSAFFSF